MCDVSECEKKSTRKAVVTANTERGSVTREVSLCEGHWKELQGEKAYSMGCSLTPNKE
jgi:hypothetical protein